jgi:hypothetical protein
MTACTKNTDCEKSYESCSLFVWTDGDGSVKQGKRCIPTAYCGKNAGNRDALTYKTMSLAGTVMCDEKKVDIAAAKKPAVVIPKTLKRLNAGHRCKTASKLIGKVEESVLTAKIAAQKSPAYSPTQQ